MQSEVSIRVPFKVPFSFIVSSEGRAGRWKDGIVPGEIRVSDLRPREEKGTREKGGGGNIERDATLGELTFARERCGYDGSSAMLVVAFEANHHRDTCRFRGRESRLAGGM